MKDWTVTDAIIKGIEAVLGAMVLLLSFVGKSMYNKFTTMEDKIEKLERSQEKEQGGILLKESLMWSSCRNRS